MEPLTKIFGSMSRLKMLRLFIFNQSDKFAFDDITKRTKLGDAVAHKELAELVVAGFLRKTGMRSKARYKVNNRFKHLEALDAFIRDTTRVRPKDMLKELRRVGTLRLVALSGLFEGIAESQIDLLVVGDHIDDRTLSVVVHSLEAELGREIRYASFSTPDFRYRLGIYDRLVRDVLDYPHRLLIDKIGL